MAKEDFTTYTEVDPNSRIVPTTRRVAFTNLTIDEIAYVYKDYGASYFSGDHKSLLTFRASAQSAAGGWLIWALTNDVADWQGLVDGNKSMVGVMLNASGNDRHIYLTGLNVGTQIGALPGYVYTFDTTYYLKVVIDSTVGANGTIYLYIYSDAARTNWLNTQGYALSVAQAGPYRYVFGLMSRNFTAGYTVSGYVEDLELFAVLTGDLEVTTQPMTDITETTATGNGSIVNLGLSSVTQHGHVWGTAIDPTTADSKTTLGAGSLGSFTSSLTGLLAGQFYVVRAYATNSQGTVYGANMSFFAGRPSSQLKAGQFAIVQTRIHYIDADGKERGGEFPLV